MGLFQGFFLKKGFDSPKGALEVINFARVDGELGEGASTLLRLMCEMGEGYLLC